MVETKPAGIERWVWWSNKKKEKAELIIYGLVNKRSCGVPSPENVGVEQKPKNY